MSDIPSTDAPRLEIAGHIARAYRTVIENAGFAARIAALPYLVMLAAGIAAALIPETVAFSEVLSGLIPVGGMVAAAPVFARRWQRFVLLGERVDARRGPARWRPMFAAALKLAALLLVAWSVLRMLGRLPPHAITAPLSSVGRSLLPLLVAPLWLALPAASVERKLRLRDGWRLGAASYGHLLAAGFACWVPFLLAREFVGWAGRGGGTLRIIVDLGLGGAIAVAGMAVSATLMAQVYRQFAET